MDIYTIVKKYCAVVILLACAPLQAQQSSTTDDGFSLVLPVGWEQIPTGAIRQFEEAIAEMSDGKIAQSYDYGYQLIQNEDWFTYPYVLAQVKRTGRLPASSLKNYAKLKRDINTGMQKAEEASSGMLSNAVQESPQYDVANHILWSGVTLDVDGIGKVKSVVALKLTNYGYIQLMGYTTEDRFENDSKLFTEMFSAVSVNETDRYSPNLIDQMTSLPKVDLSQSTIITIIAGLVVLGLLLLFSFRAKK